MTAIGDAHVHSKYSTDSSADMREMIEAAIKAGLPHICFTDHIDYDYPVKGVEFSFDVDAYLKEIDELKEEYRDRIEVQSGVELGLQKHLADTYKTLLKKYPFDFVIGSEHLVRGMDPYYPDTFDGVSDAELYHAYFEETLENIRSFHDFDSLGHLDYIVRYGRHKNRDYSYSAYSDTLDEILKWIIREGLALEVNTAGIRKMLGFPNPNPDVLRKYRELGGTLITIGSDSHKPYSLGYAFEDTRTLLKDCGFTHYAYYVQRRPKFVKL